MNKVKDIILNKELIKSYRKKNLRLPCLFLDRDGVIIKDCHYIKRSEDVVLEKGAFKLIKKAFYKNWIIVIITNQSGISKGIITWDDYKLVTNKMISFFEFANPFAAIYANGLAYKGGAISWRKPSPEMILQSLKDLPIDLDKSILIGDRITDLKAGLNAGIPQLFHVKTGHGEKEREVILKNNDLANKIELTNIPLKKTNIKLINNLEEFPMNTLN